MRVLFLSSYVDPGSGASILIRLATRFKEEGHEVKILTTKPGYDSNLVESVRLAPAVGVINTALNKLVPNYFSFHYFSLLKAVRKFNPEVINIHWTHGSTIPVQLIARLAREWPVFWTIHDLWPITVNTFFEFTGGKTLLGQRTTVLQRIKRSLKFSPKILFKYKARALGRAEIHTISPSRWLREKVSASPVFKSATNHHIPNGVDVNVFRPLDRKDLRKHYGLPEDGKVILFLSANLADPRKGFYYFVKALDHLKANDPELMDRVTTLLVGANSEGAGKYLPTRVRNLGGTKDVSTLVEYFNLADIFVSASIADNFPSTSLESLACGTPIVAFDVGGVSEIVRHRETGLLAKSKDIGDLAENIRQILTDEKFRETLSVNGRNHAADRLSMDRFVNDYLGLFQQASLEHGNRL